jgi:hypothetical protein
MRRLQQRLPGSLVVGLVVSLLGLFATLAPTTWPVAPTSLALAKQTPKPAAKPLLPERALGVPLVRQQQDYSCGPAAMSGVLQFFGVWKGKEQELYKILETSTTEGTLPENLALGARHFGLIADVEQPMTIERLRTLVGQGKLVILELQAWREGTRKRLPWRDDWDDGHYVVLVGIDRDFAYFMDPSTSDAYTFMPLGELPERWHDINQTRKDPAKQRDLQLGVVIGASPGAGAKVAKPATRKLKRLE